jgi:hypothetical protein
MVRGQDWCLECGNAAPGRLGARPGWRAAFTVVGLTTLLLLCAVVAAYAALTSDSERAASAPSTGDAGPIVAATPTPGTTPPAATVQPGATGPGTTPPATNPNAKPLIPVAPPGKATNTPVAPPAAAGKGAPAAPGPAAAPTSDPAPTGSAAAPAPGDIALKRDAAKTYNPLNRAGAEFGPAANAIDSKSGSVWDVVVPADGQPIGAGLVIDLGKPYALSSLRLSTATEGFTVEIYGAKSAKQLPVDVIDKRWIHLTDSKGTLDNDPISLKGKGEGAKVQLVLLYFTVPATPTDPKVAIKDVKLRGTP